VTSDVFYGAAMAPVCLLSVINIMFNLVIPRKLKQMKGKVDARRSAVRNMAGGIIIFLLLLCTWTMAGQM